MGWGQGRQILHRKQSLCPSYRGLTSKRSRSCVPGGRSHDRGEAGSATSRSVEAEPRSTSRFRDSRLQNSVRKAYAMWDEGVSMLVADFAILVPVAIVET